MIRQDATYAKEYGACIRITLLEEDTEKYVGELRRKRIPTKTVITTKGTNEVIREYDGYANHIEEYDRLSTAIDRVIELIKSDQPFMIEEVADGRTGDNHSSRLGPTDMWILLNRVMEAGK